VGELRNVMNFVAAIAEGPMVDARELPERLGPPSGEWAIGLLPLAPPESPRGRVWRNLYDEIRELERKRISEALAETNGVRVRAAELIGIPLRTLVTKIREYGLSDAGNPSRKPGER